MFNRVVLAMLLMVVLAGTLAAKKARKLPAKAYVQSAKIEILGYGESREQARIVTAMAMLDSLIMHYGPHSEGYYWYSQIKWDLGREKADLKEKLPLVQAAVAYSDSLKWTCGNKEIDKKYRKDCEDLDEQMDSIKVAQWRDFYNAGVEQITEVEELMETVKVESDSSALAYYQTRLDALVDSCQDNMALAINVDSTDTKPFVGLANVHEKIGNFQTALGFLKRALPIAEDRTQLLTQIAYDYIQDNDYCGSIPWFREYIDSMTVNEQVMQDPENRPSVIGTAHNLAICYNNCKEYDSANSIFQLILSFDPESVDALIGAGRYQQHRGREAGDSAKYYRDNADETTGDKWREVRNQRFDSARIFLKQAYEVDNGDADLAAEYGLMAAILEDYEEARVAFARACELNPDDVDYWTSLGDCELSLHNWAESAAAYERVVELRPDNKVVWERLSDLYLELGNQGRRAEILEKLESM